MTNLFRYIYLVTFLLLFSCQESEESKLSRLVEEWEGREIIIPQNLGFTIKGEPASFHPSNAARYKIISYIDSVGCISCKLRLRDWDRYIHEMDSITNHGISFFFYCQPKLNGTNEFIHQLKFDHFDYPICIDSVGYFSAVNKLPEEKSLQVMLLDSNNRVIAMGNPILNPKVADIYLNVILGKSMQENSTESNTLISIDKDLIEVGSLKYNETVTCNFEITNTGKSVLYIDDIVTSCECTTVEYVFKTLQPGESEVISVTVKSEDKGEFYRDISIFCNIEDSPSEVRIHGFSN